MSFALIKIFLSPPAARHTQDLHKTPRRRRHWHSDQLQSPPPSPPPFVQPIKLTNKIQTTLIRATQWCRVLPHQRRSNTAFTCSVNSKGTSTLNSTPSTNSLTYHIPCRFSLIVPVQLSRRRGSRWTVGRASCALLFYAARISSSPNHRYYFTASCW